MRVKLTVKLTVKLVMKRVHEHSIARSDHK